MRILLIEDDKTVSQNISLILKREDIIVDASYKAEDGIESARLYDYDLILLDLGLPDMEGCDVIRKLRSMQISTPIMVLSGMGSIDKKVHALTFGCDDYLTKPFDTRELIARINALVRRSKGYCENIIRTGGMEVNLDSKIITITGTELNLTTKEYALFELLALRKGALINKGQCLDHLYGGRDEPEAKILDVFLCKIRRKIEKVSPQEEYIQTVRGRGYILKDLPVLQ